MRWKKLAWSQRLKNCLYSIDAEYILFFIEDFFLMSPVNEEFLNQATDLSEVDYLFFIDKADDKDLNEQPIKSNSSLFEILNSAKYSKRLSNLQFEKQKKLRKEQERKTIKSRVKRKLNRWRHRKEYIHTKQC